jgi:predicted nucleotidyltransferase
MKVPDRGIGVAMSGRTFPTLAQRKAERAAGLRAALATLRGSLESYARTHGGRFLLFGSAARGEMRYDSDVDLLLDFPEDRLSEAWRYAEQVCRDLGLQPDLCPLAWYHADFVARVRDHAVTLG